MEDGPSMTVMERIEAAHREQAGYCDLLECIADTLPRPEPFLCRRAVMVFGRDIPLHHRDGREGLFPLLRLRCGPEDAIVAVLARLEDEYDDEAAALPEAATEMERLAVRHEPQLGADALGYMLRGVFETRRRHLAWEMDVVMPLVRRRLTACDRVLLGQIMDRNRVTLPPTDTKTEAGTWRN